MANLDPNLQRGIDRSFRNMLEEQGMPVFGIADFSLFDFLNGIYPQLTTQSILTTTGPGHNGLTINAVPALNSSDHILSIQNNGVEVFFIKADGSLPIGIGLPGQAGHSGQYLTTDGLNASWAPTSPVLGNPATLKGTAADGPSAVAGVVDTSVAWANASAKLLSLRNNGVEKFYVKADGSLPPGVALPDQTGKSGDFLSTDGSSASWQNLGKVYNVKNYGATGDGSTDDTTAIEAAIAAAKADTTFLSPGATVYFPKGIYRHQRPFYLPQSATFKGEGSAQSILQPLTYNGPSIIAGLDHTLPEGGSDGMTFGPSLVTGPGFCLQQNVDGWPYGEFLDLSAYNNLVFGSAWTVNFYVKFRTTPGIGTDDAIIRLGGSLMGLPFWTDTDGHYQAGDSQLNIGLGIAATAWELLVVNGGGGPQLELFFRWNNKMWLFPIQTASYNFLTVGAVYNLELNWDGTHIRFFINGELWTSGAALPSAGIDISGSAVPADSSGFITRGWERLFIGNGSADNYPGYLVGLHAKTDIDALHIRSVAWHTSNFTPTNAKAVPIGSDLLILNFDKFYKDCIIATGSGNEDVYFRQVPKNVVAMSDICIRDMGFVGGAGIITEFAFNSLIENITTLYCTDGWQFLANGFFSKYRNIQMSAGLGNRGGWVMAGGPAYITMDDIVTSSPIGYAISAGNLTSNNCSYSRHAGYSASLKISGGGTQVWNGFSVDNEEATTKWVAALILGDVQACQFNAATLYNDFPVSTTPPVFAIHSGEFEDSRYLFETCYFPNDGITAIIKTFGPLFTFKNPIQLRNSCFELIGTSKLAVSASAGVNAVPQVIDPTIRRDKYFNVIEYGAKGDGVTDDTVAIQAAINAAKAAYGTPGPDARPATVYFPNGRYITSSTLILTDAFANFIGDGPSSSVIGPPTYFTGQIGLLVAPSSKPFAGNFLVSSLLTGPGSAAQFPGGSPYTLNLRESVPTLSGIDGTSAFCLRFQFRPDSTPVGNGNRVFYLGSEFGTDSTGPFIWYMDYQPGTSTYHFWLRIGFTQVDLDLGAMTNGVAYNLQFDYDGAHIRAFKNGIVVASSVQTGAVAMTPASEFSIGSPVNTAYVFGGISSAPFTIDSIEFALVSRNTSNFTPPTTKYTVDANTIFLINFDDTAHNQIVRIEVPWYGVGARSDQILYAWPPDPGASQPGATVKDLGFTRVGQGLVLFSCPEARVENIESLARTCIRLDNSFSTRIDNVSLLGFGPDPRYGLLATNACNNIYVTRLTSQSSGFPAAVTGSNEIRFDKFFLIGGHANLYTNVGDNSIYREGLFTYEGQGVGGHWSNVIAPGFGIGPSTTFDHCGFGNESAGITQGSIYTIAGGFLIFKSCSFFGFGDVLYAINNNLPGDVGYGTELRFDSVSFSGFTAKVNPSPGATAIISDINAPGAATFIQQLGTKSITYSASSVLAGGNQPLDFIGNPTDGSSAIGVKLRSNTSLANATAKLISIQNNTTEKAYFDKDGGLVLASGGLSTHTNSAAGNITAATTDYYIGITGVGGGTVTLPPVASVTTGQIMVIKDEGGNASASPITVDANAAELIDGQLTQSLAINYGSMTLVMRNAAWWII